MNEFGIKNVCVFAASSNAVDRIYTEAARRLGTGLAKHGYTLVYGGGNNGLMGSMARAAHAQGGRVVGVIPDRLRGLELAYEGCDELIVTADLRRRKGVMERRADAFIALPGGFGTLEETLEILTLRQLLFHQKPVIFLNVRGIYDGLFQFLTTLEAERFIPLEYRRLYHACATPEDAVAFLDAYEPAVPEEAPE